MTDGIQTATHADWTVLQDNDVDTEFTLTIEGLPVPNWDDVTIEAVLWIPEEVDLSGVAEKSVEDDPTTVIVPLTAAQTARPLTGRFRISAFNAFGQRITNRYGVFKVERTRPAGTEPVDSGP